MRDIALAGVSLLITVAALALTIAAAIGDLDWRWASLGWNLSTMALWARALAQKWTV